MKKARIIFRIDGKNYPINSTTYELITKLFNISIKQEQPTIYQELKAYKGVGKAQSELLAAALKKPIIWPNHIK